VGEVGACNRTRSRGYGGAEAHFPPTARAAVQAPSIRGGGLTPASSSRWKNWQVVAEQGTAAQDGMRHTRNTVRRKHHSRLSLSFSLYLIDRLRVHIPPAVAQMGKQDQELLLFQGAQQKTWGTRLQKPPSKQRSAACPVRSQGLGLLFCVPRIISLTHIGRSGVRLHSIVLTFMLLFAG